MNSKDTPAYWWVNQGKQFTEESAGGFIWAPKNNQGGHPSFHHVNVSRVTAGEYIFHYAKGHLRAISRAKSNAYEAKKESSDTPWSDAGWRVDTDFMLLQTPIPIEKIGRRLADMHMANGPINKEGGVNQGYLYALSEDAVRFLISQIGDDPAIRDSGISQSITLPNSRTSALSLSGLGELFFQNLSTAAVRSNKDLITRFTAAILSKRFLILTGLAGSGKTKLAQAFARWITPTNESDSTSENLSSSYYALLPVGADWTGNENILGYPDGLQAAHYITKPALELILRASEPQNAKVPHFLILDEMNLSHVERYFADLLSAIESGEEIPLYDGDARHAGEREIPTRLRLPDNLFIIGTVNVDETTYMFSPKVLDRANVIEFRMEADEMESFLSSPTAPRLEELDGKGASFGKEFVEAAANRAVAMPAIVSADYEREMLLFFNLLREHNVEFGYRTAFESSRLVHFYKLLGGFSDDDSAWFERAMDAVIIQKLLPKLHGSRSRLEGLLWALAWACGAERAADADFGAQLRKAGKAEDEYFDPQLLWNVLEKRNADDPVSQARYPLSFDKVMRMWRKLVRDQFVNFAEA